MTSRYTSEKALSPAQGGSDDPPPSDTSSAVPANVVLKLLGFTVGMVVIPLGSFFFTRAYVFAGNSTYSGGFAALMANVVLIAYIVVAVLEDQGDNVGKMKKKD